MKILQVLEATEGGTRTHLDHILKGLHSDFTMQYIYSLERDPSYADTVKEYTALGIECVEVPMVRNVSPLKDRASIKQIRAVMEEFKPDIVHVHSSKAGYAGRKAAAGSSSHVVYTPHCLFFPAQKGLKRKLFKWAEQSCEKYTDTFIAVSDYEKQNLIDHITSEDKVVRIDNGVDIPDLSEGHRSMRVVFAARAAAQKGWDLFLDVARSVISSDPEVQFVFAGEGSQLSTMRERVKSLGLSEKVKLPGHVDNIVPEYLNASAAAVTSRWEGQPYSVLEAMACACPVIAFDIPGMNELVQKGETGYLAQPFNANDFSEKLLSLLKDPETAARMGMAGREVVKASYTRKQFVEKMREFYNQCIPH